MQFTSEQLIRCKEKEADAQRALYSLFKGAVMGLCRRYTKSKEEAEDVFQETFIRVFQNIYQLNDIKSLEPWIKRIAVNSAVNYYHRNKRHYNQADYLDHDGKNEDYELMLANLNDQDLLSFINDLPEGYRIVFNLYVVEGYSHAEIAALLAISEATSRSQLNRAKQALKERLKGIGIFKYEICSIR
jgi:RNA polymerase sigma-70 factor (ECF subfamily)